MSDEPAPEPEPEAPVHTWVADRGTAWSVAYAMTVLEVSSLRFRLFAVAVVIGLPAFLVAAGPGGVAFPLLLGLALAAFLLISAVLITAWGRCRNFRALLPPGLVLSTQFGPDHLVLRRRWTETTVQFRAYDRLDIVHDWVFLRQRERRIRVVYPMALMPRDDLARLRLTILGLVPEGH